MLATAVTVCSLLPVIFDDIILRREVLGYTRQQYLEYVAALPDMPVQLRRRMEMTSFVLFALPKGSNYDNAKLQITLACNNKETIRAYQYPSEGAGR